MNKIKQSKTDVNNNSSIIALKRLFYLQNKQKECFEQKRLDNGAIDFQILKPLGDKITNNCPFNVPYSFAENPRLKEPREKKTVSPAKKYKRLFTEATNGEITNTALRSTLNLWVKKLGNVCIKNQNGYSFFESNAKGTNRYNKRNYWKIHDFCKQEDSYGKKAYFCTFTCANSVKKDNIIEKWKQFSKQLNNTLKILSAKFGVEYVCVKESFLSGFPHAHVIFYVKDFLQSDKQRYLRTKKYSVVVSGKLKETLNKCFTIGYTELVRNTKKGTSNYLSKYISKNETTGLKKLVNKKKWTNADRKQILTTFMPIVANVRQFQKSVSISVPNRGKVNFEHLNISAGKNDNAEMDIIKKSLFLSDSEFLKRGRASDYLITLCNNLPKCIQNEVRILSNKTLWKFTSEQITAVNGETNEYKGVIFKKSCPLTCSKCVYSKFLAELLKNVDNPAVNAEENLAELALQNGDNTEVMAKVSEQKKITEHTKKFIKKHDFFIEKIKEKKMLAAQHFEFDIATTVEYNAEEYEQIEIQIIKGLKNGTQQMLF